MRFSASTRAAASIPSSANTISQRFRSVCDGPPRRSSHLPIALSLPGGHTLTRPPRAAGREQCPLVPRSCFFSIIPPPLSEAEESRAARFSLPLAPRERSPRSGGTVARLNRPLMFAGGAPLNPRNLLGGLPFAPFVMGGLFFLLHSRLLTPISAFPFPNHSDLWRRMQSSGGWGWNSTYLGDSWCWMARRVCSKRR